MERLHARRGFASLDTLGVAARDQGHLVPPAGERRCEVDRVQLQTAEAVERERANRHADSHGDS